MKNTVKYSVITYSIMLKQLFSLRLFTFLFIFIFSFEAFAQGGLMITPRRVVFDGTSKTQHLNIANTGSEPASYVISYIQYRMKEDGVFEQITVPDSGQFFANDYLRLYPRKITLEPREAQLVKVQLRNYQSLADGEYRSHIYFRSVKEETPLEDNQLKDTTSFSIRLTPIYGISIPVIIRKGESTTKVNLSNVKLDVINDTLSKVNITFNRTGNMSVYGDIKVDYISPDNKKTQVGLVRGMAVYTPNLLRQFRVDLISEDVDFHKGKLHIVYNTRVNGKVITLAEDELILH